MKDQQTPVVVLPTNSPVLARLMEEVKFQKTSPHVYDRIHNRHNR